MNLLLKNGLIVDGTGKKGFTGDILINGPKIEAISETPISVESATFDCSGLVIAPGFIDVHSHMDWVLPLEGFDRLKTSFTAQGCTTFVTGNCGYSPGPFRKNSAYRNLIRLGADRRFEITWDSMGGYFQRLRDVGLTHNIVHLAGHGTTRTSLRGLNPAPLEKHEAAEMLVLLEEAMDQGAAGVSLGLGYEPGMFASVEEIAEIARLVRKKDKILTVHGRAYSLLSGFYSDRDTPHNVLSLQEMISIARETQVRLQYSHLMFAGSKTHSTYRQCLDVLDRAVSEGVDVMIDTYPYHCGSSVINVLLPPWFLAGAPANYTDPRALTRVEQGLDNMSRHIGFGYADIQLTFAGHPDFNDDNGMFIDEIAGRRGVPPSRIVLGLSEKTKGRARILNHNYSNMEIIDALMYHPACLFMTDSVPSVEGVQNPASYGAFPLLLQYARERRLISLEEAVRKMTGASADRLNIKNRGVLRKGLAADITVFNWKTIKDNNTVKETDKEPDGIEAVFINGRHVKKDGKVDTLARPGTIVSI